MPTVGVDRDALFKALGRKYTEEEFADLCFDFGLELDEVVDEDDGRVTYKVDVGANRYDLLCLEGLARAILVFVGKRSVPKYRRLDPAPGKAQRLTIERSTSAIRPYCVAAVLRNVTFDETRYKSFIDLQDKLHQNIARKRSLVAIGTHDLDAIRGPFRYVALPPADIKFVALNQTREHTAPELMELYSADSHLKPYLPIIRDSPVYPVIYDADGVVLSMPPIINGDKSKISTSTKNVFIECTGTDFQRTKVVLDTMVTMFSEHCGEQFTVEAVDVTTEATGETAVYPTLSTRTEVIQSDKVNKCCGIKVGSEDIAGLLNKMCFTAKALDGERVEVEVPPTRHDVLHACDIYEDVAIAYGYNNIERTLPRSMTIGKQMPLNKLSDQLREQIAQGGFTEALTFSLCSRDDVSTKLRQDMSGIPAVSIANPKTLEFQIVRTTLLPGLLKTLQANKNLPLPLKLFEISDVVFRDAARDVGARNERHLAAVLISKTSGFETVHGLLDRVMALLEVPRKAPADADRSAGYYLKKSDDPTYFPGRCAEVVAFGVSVGRVGVLHPESLAKFDLSLPASALEINIEPFL